jgi:hypothetical protein
MDSQPINKSDSRTDATQSWFFSPKLASCCYGVTNLQPVNNDRRTLRFAAVWRASMGRREVASKISSTVSKIRLSKCFGQQIRREITLP